ncbi:cyclopropane-fatty-acyl-phospholipid synthase family protein [Aestuariivita sp.]|jgi:cyclopropane-fatty-acyl-phospholipid synthase|uniref:SAM-dependent methyltransferase n=1 Tax=Aestuariivita sp. TaxID=1872407 RepID=UPI00216D7DEA|nr:cyclopropane-fatty-acyl-phospholipid synthase family protein [Aestuariivita sp.]MCE8008693.1 class I SAM-dependent methyltransferase [Aestuariivita sp.]
MWKRLFDRMAVRLIGTGRLTITYPDGETRHYGPGGAKAAMHIRTPEALRALCLTPELALGEGYMDDTIEIGGNAELEALLRLLLENRKPGAFPAYIRALDRVRFHARAIVQRNSARSARANVAHHYDISDDLYRLMLDEDMQYSCAYFARPDMSLEEAQAAKKRHIAQKLLIERDMHVLDIGCGWGGMALTLARDYGARVTGVTLSENQLATAQARTRAAGLEDRVAFRLMDYRALEDQFDRIVSVGMLEHVGLPHYGDYFAKVAELLDPDGVALIHTIGRVSPPMAHSPWIHKYIFPGGYVPSLSELLPALEASALWQTDIEVWRLHYARTLREWRARFDANLDTVQGWYDARFIRMWRYYLTACIMAFEGQAQCVYHLQLAHRRDAVPLTRDYLYAPDAAHRHAAE